MAFLRPSSSSGAVPATKAHGFGGLAGIGSGLNGAAYPEPSFESYSRAGFGRNELVYACVMEKATSLSEAPLRVYGPDGIGDPLEGHPLRRLVSNPNAVTTEQELFELLVVHLELAGNAFLEIVRDRSGRPVELWPLRPDLVRILRTSPSGHEYGLVVDGRIVSLGRDVLHVKYPNPLDPYVGHAPLRTAVRSVALDNEATDFVKVLLQNHAVPPVVVQTQEALDDATVTRLRARWRERFSGANRGTPAFLQKGMEAKVLGLNLRDLEFPDLRTVSETRICSVFGVPPILVGAKAGLDRSTFANYAEARRSFWEETLLPLQRRIRDVMAKRLLPELNAGAGSTRGSRAVVRFDTSGVLALQESEQARWERATQALRAGALTVNDFRRAVGMPQVPGADVFLRPAGVIPTDAEGRPLFDPQASGPAADTDSDTEGNA